MANDYKVAQIAVVSCQYFAVFISVLLAIVASIKGRVNFIYQNNWALYSTNYSSLDFSVGYWFGVFLLLAAILSTLQIKFENKGLTIVAAIVQIITACVCYIALSFSAGSFYINAMSLALYEHKESDSTTNFVISSKSVLHFILANQVVVMALTLFGFFSTIFQVCFHLKRHFSCCRCCECCTDKDGGPESEGAGLVVDERTSHRHSTKFVVLGFAQLLLAAFYFFFEIAAMLELEYSQLGLVTGIGLTCCFWMLLVGGLSFFTGRTGQRGITIGTGVMAVLAAIQFAGLILVASLLIAGGQVHNLAFTMLLIMGIASFGMLITQSIFCWHSLCACCRTRGSANPEMVYMPDHDLSFQNPNDQPI